MPFLTAHTLCTVQPRFPRFLHVPLFNCSALYVPFRHVFLGTWSHGLMARQLVLPLPLLPRSHLSIPLLTASILPPFRLLFPPSPIVLFPFSTPPYPLNSLPCDSAAGADAPIARATPTHFASVPFVPPFFTPPSSSRLTREIEDTVLLALLRPDVYDSIARATRTHFESNRPRAVLFDGPPGTGKTSCARAMAKRASVPLVYVPLESVASKYYGESERQLSTVFVLANQLHPGGAIVFLDEVDALATARDSDMHEATRRVLSVLLRE
ncbi:unnamed protein product, partial [Closterium sp. NIES-54]